MRRLTPSGLVPAAIAPGATTPNPGYQAQAWSTIADAPVFWDGTRWLVGGVASDQPTAVPAGYSLGSLLTTWNTTPGAGTSGGTRTTDDSDMSPDPDGRNVLQLPWVAGNAAVYDHIPTAAFDLSAHKTIGIWAKATPRADGDKYSMVKLIFAESTANFTNHGNCTLCLRADGRWRFHVISTAALGVGAGSWTIATPVARLRVIEGDASSATNRAGLASGQTISLGSLRGSPKQRPMAIIRFDDGISNMYTSQTVSLASQYVGNSGITVAAGSYSMKTLLDAFGFVGTAFINTDAIGQSGFETVAGLTALHAAGWDICLQSKANPVGYLGAGSRLLGPLGYNLIPAGGISSVNTTSGLMTTVAAEHGIGGTTTGQPFIVVAFGTNLPAELTAGTTYYLYRVSASTFTVHTSPTGSWDGATGKVIPTSSGTLANWGFRCKGSTNDESGIVTDFSGGYDWLVANGFGRGAPFLGLNQGAWDIYVERAFFSVGKLKAVATTALNGAYNGAGTGAAIPVFEPCHTHPVSNDTTWSAYRTLQAPWLNLTASMQTDTAGSGLGSTVVRQFVRNAVANGWFIANFHHGMSPSTNQDLLHYLDELRIWSVRGMIDVGRISSLWSSVYAARQKLAAELGPKSPA